MTLPQAKDKVAKDVYGHPDWETFRADGLDWRVYRDAADEVAEVYAKSKWDEACDEMNQSLGANFLSKGVDLMTDSVSSVVNTGKIFHSIGEKFLKEPYPKPEFKP